MERGVEGRYRRTSGWREGWRVGYRRTGGWREGWRVGIGEQVGGERSGG